MLDKGIVVLRGGGDLATGIACRLFNAGFKVLISEISEPTVVRGMIHEGYEVHENMKIADVDPRAVAESCFSISDKARSVGGGVLEAILYLENKGKRENIGELALA